jgi:endonuclease YncB( thermonuclease family)
MVSGIGCSKKEEAPPVPTPVPEAAATPLEVATAAPTPIPTETISGKVIQVVGVSALKVQEGKKKIDVRLYGIVSPGKKSPVLAKAKAYVAKVTLKKKISVEVTEKSGSRIIGVVTLASGANLNHELLKKGYASLDPNVTGDDMAAQLQDEAKTAKRGIWAAPKKKARRHR